MDKELIESLISGAEKLCLEINTAQAEKMLDFMEAVINRNRVMNLTSVIEPKQFVETHIIDSLTPLPFIPESASVMDVGTGAGFPGIILKIAREDISLTLLDSTGKKLDFIREASSALAIDVAEFVHRRAEEASHEPEYREKYDITIARAVAVLPVLCEYCLPFVKLGGSFIAMKGRDISAETASAEKTISVLGAGKPGIERLILPYSASERNLIIYPKEHPTPGKYPRANAVLRKLAR
ncbi:MAG: 16S rRNA (guanine(527)-N(7))-methyltransferase RsmG [Eubacteriaceae bacterium]|nr:16S rRNA (guanine(527)-N(7))-methyltransferase RsmG [Eubacteriaceae bacterium]